MKNLVVTKSRHNSVKLILLLVSFISLSVLLQITPLSHASDNEMNGGTPIKLLQYNVQFLTPDFLESLGYTIPGHFPNTIERAQAIGQEIACYDIIALQETVNNERRHEILESMNEAASNCGKDPILPDGQYFNAVHGPDLEQPYPLIFTPEDVIDILNVLFDCDASDPDRLDDPIVDDELTIVSRFPIIETHSLIYSQRECIDSAAAKGVLHARLWRGGNFPTEDTIDVFATHLQVGSFVDVQESQIRELAKFVHSHNDPSTPVIIMGDFNINGNEAEQTTPLSTYNFLMNTLRSELQIKDIGIHLGGTNEDGSERIDYIFMSPFALEIENEIEDVRVNWFNCADLGLSFCDDYPQPRLSDHAGVEADMIWLPKAVAQRPALNEHKMLSVNVSRLTLLSTDSCNEFADYYGRLTIDDGLPERALYWVNEGNDIGPDWVLTKRIEPGVQEVTVTLEIRDEDDPVCGGGDDHVDVNPLPEEKTVNLRVNLAEQQVYLVNKEGAPVQILSAVGQPFFLEGTSGDEVGRVVATISTQLLEVEQLNLDDDREIFLTVEHLKATSDDACDDMEFYGTLQLENGANASRKFDIADDSNELSPGWYVNGIVSARTQSVDAFIKVREEDDFFCGGGDDDVDVNPDPEQKAVKVRVDFLSQRVYLLDKDGNLGDDIGSFGSPIILQGFNGDETAIVTFRLDARSQVVSPPSAPLPPVNTERPLTLTVDRLQVMSKDACSDFGDIHMDIFGTIRLENGLDASFSIGEDDNIDTNDFVPGWRIGGTVSAGVATVDAYIKIQDDDDAVCGGGDDIVHISPDSEDAVRVRINLLTGQIHLLNDDNGLGPQVGVIGQPVELIGSYPDETGRVIFRIDLGPQVNHPPTLELQASPIEQLEGSAITLSGILIQPGWLDAATVSVNWDDDSPEEFVNQEQLGQPLEFNLSHIYRDNGNYNIQVCGSDDNITVCSTVLVYVENVPPTVEAGDDQVVFEDDLFLLTATFTDPGTLDTHVALIDWGDSTIEEGSISETDGSGIVLGEHLYHPGRYTVTITVEDDDGGTGMDTFGLVVVHGFLKYGVFGQNTGDSVVKVSSQTNINGDLGGNGDIELGKYASVTGNLVSKKSEITLMEGASAQGNLTAAKDIGLSVETHVVGNLVSGHNIELLSGSVVTGSVSAAGWVELKRGATVIGPVYSGANVSPPYSITPAIFSNIAGEQDVNVESGETVILPPGSYGLLETGAGVTITLSSGEYAFERIEIGQGAIVNFDLDEGPIVVRVLTDLKFSNDILMIVDSNNGDATDVIFLIRGRSVEFGLRGNYLGTYLGPQASIKMNKDSTLEGALYGGDVKVLASTTLTENPAFDLFISLFLPLE